MRSRTPGRRPDATPDSRVSTLCLGTMPFGTRVAKAKCFTILDRFGDSEEAVGRWPAARGSRDEIVLATKTGASPAPARRRSAVRQSPSPAGHRRSRGVRHACRRRHRGHRRRRQPGHLADRTRPLTDWLHLRPAAVHVSAARPDPTFGKGEHVTPELLDYAGAEKDDDLTLLAYTPLPSRAYANPAKPVPGPIRPPGRHRATPNAARGQAGDRRHRSRPARQFPERAGRVLRDRSPDPALPAGT